MSRASVPTLVVWALLVSTAILAGGSPRPCGPGLPECVPGQFCRIADGECLNTANGFCEPLPASCPPDVDPVCGCDSSSHQNACMALAAGVSIFHSGVCPLDNCGGDFCFADQYCRVTNDDCWWADPLTDGTCTTIPVGCPPLDAPVCGCDGITYDNECELELAQMNLHNVGACPEPGESCGEFTNYMCSEPEDTCFLGDGCCCDLGGSCYPQPVSCPDVCAPVFGCDDQHYQNRCLADMAPMAVKHAGACEEVWGVRFVTSETIDWALGSGALSFNIYRKTVSGSPPGDMGDCWLSGIGDTFETIPSVPQPGELWLLQVTGEFIDGEGTLGYGGSGCTERQPAEACGN